MRASAREVNCVLLGDDRKVHVCLLHFTTWTRMYKRFLENIRKYSIDINTAANEGNFTLHIGDNHSQIELRPFLLQCKECLVHVFLEVLVYPR